MKIKAMAVKAITLSKELAMMAGEWDKDVAGKPVKAKAEIQAGFDQAKKDGILNTAIEVIGEEQVFFAYKSGIAELTDTTAEEKKEKGDK